GSRAAAALHARNAAQRLHPLLREEWLGPHRADLPGADLRPSPDQRDAPVPPARPCGAGGPLLLPPHQPPGLPVPCPSRALAGVDVLRRLGPVLPPHGAPGAGDGTGERKGRAALGAAPCPSPLGGRPGAAGGPVRLPAGAASAALGALTGRLPPGG